MPQIGTHLSQVDTKWEKPPSRSAKGLKILALISGTGFANMKTNLVLRLPPDTRFLSFGSSQLPIC